MSQTVGQNSSGSGLGLDKCSGKVGRIYFGSWLGFDKPSEEKARLSEEKHTIGQTFCRSR